MLGDSSVLGSSFSRGDNTAAVAAPESGGGGGGGGDGGGGGSINSGEDSFRGGGEELLGGGERLSFGGNRWPRQETIALLQIRSDMDVAFRDASVKGPLWDEVSRKLAALGYHRSAKKCKEKFENVYKYHRRTKEGRTGKSEGKTYRFFDQLSAFENQPPTPGSTSTPHQQQARPHPPTMAAAAATMASMSNSSTIPLPANPLILPTPPQPPSQQPPMPNPNHLPHHNTFPSSFPTISTDLLSNSTSSSTSSDEELEGRAKRKRKWKDFFERLMKEVVQKQDDLQRRFLEAIEKREHERMVREEAWRMQEMARINREREILAQERSIAAAKDAAVMSFLQKVSEQQQTQNQNQNQSTQPGQAQAQANNNNNLVLPLPPPPMPPPPRPPAATPAPQSLDTVPKASNNGEMTSPAMSSSRWPKVEVQALIQLRTNLDAKYQENGPKGPLWEEISGQMKKLGYNRNSKRCKEKWENINKYFKKVKESNKTRPEDSKTCPYFHLLDSLYRERNKFDRPNNNVGGGGTDSSGLNQVRPENAVPLMVRPEQQWPPQQQQEGDHHDKENVGDEDDEDDDEDEEEDDDGNFEVVANKPAPVGASAAE